MQFTSRRHPFLEAHRFALVRLLCLMMVALAASSPGLAEVGGPNSAKSGKLVGDGLILEWRISGADFDKPFFADRTWQAQGSVAARRVTFSGTLRASVPHAIYTNASMSAYVAIPLGPKQEVSWRGELSDAAGLSHELPFSLQLDVPPGKAVYFNAGVGKTGGATDMLGIMFVAAAQNASGPLQQTTAPLPAPGVSWIGALKAIAAILAVLAVLAILVLIFRSRLSATSGLGSPNVAADPEAQQVAAVSDALQKAADDLRASGRYIANASLVDKVWYGVPHIAKEGLSWLQETFPEGVGDPHDEALTSAMRNLTGSADPLPRPPLPDPDPNWGQCGEAAQWGAAALAEPIRRIFGPDAVFTKIALQSNMNPFGNHIANEVITPSGSRYVVDMWSAMQGKPKVCTEAEWLDKWKSHAWIGSSVRIERGDAGSDKDSYLEACIQQNGIEKGIEIFRRAMRKNPGQAETVIKSFRKYPWPIDVVFQGSMPPPPDVPMPLSRGKFK